MRLAGRLRRRGGFWRLHAGGGDTSSPISRTYFFLPAIFNFSSIFVIPLSSLFFTQPASAPGQPPHPGTQDRIRPAPRIPHLAGRFTNDGPLWSNCNRSARLWQNYLLQWYAAIFTIAWTRMSCCEFGSCQRGSSVVVIAE